MPTWKLEIEYEGTRYRGWQIQHNAKTVQGELIAAARELFSAKVEIGGSGRTDAGVHAVRQIAHLKVPELKANVTPAKIKAQRNQTGVNESGGGAKNDFVVHRAAARRMRMTNERDAARFARRLFQNRFKLPDRRRNEQIAFRIHNLNLRF